MKALVVSLLLLTAVSINYASVSDDYCAELKGVVKSPGDAAKAQQFGIMAMKEHEKKNYKLSEELWYRAAKADPSNPKYFFNLACATARQGKGDIAIQYLNIVKQWGDGKYLDFILLDDDLDGLRNSAMYEDFFRGIRKLAGNVGWAEGLLGKKLARSCSMGSCAGGMYANYEITLLLKGALKGSGGITTRGEDASGMNPSAPVVIESCLLVGGTWRFVKDTLVIELIFCNKKKGTVSFKSMDECMRFFSDDCGDDDSKYEMNFIK